MHQSVAANVDLETNIAANVHCTTKRAHLIGIVNAHSGEAL